MAFKIPSAARWPQHEVGAIREPSYNRSPTCAQLLFVDDCVVDLHALSVRSLRGLGSRLAVAGKNGSSSGRDFAILLVDDLDCIVINFVQRGCIPVRIAFDRIVLSVKLAAPLVVTGLAFCVDSIIRKSKPPLLSRRSC
jgi:hypothetical protein